MRLIPPALSLGCLILSSMCLAQTTNWVQVKTTNSPPARPAQGMAHDFIRRRTVLFGGGNRLNDTWEYDGKSWMQLKPKTVPPGRRAHSMVFDVARVRTLLFGGQGFGIAFRNDTWIWNGRDWTQLKPATSPSARDNFALAYDSARGRAVLFGGGDGTNVLLGDTWEWDGKNWTQVKPQTSPPARIGHGMAYDSARKRIVLFGGQGNGRVLNDTWEYDGRSWVIVAPKTRPSPRSWHGMAYDTARRRTVVFGGHFVYRPDTWEYDGKDWTKMSPFTHPKGSSRWGNELMVYDLRWSRMVLFGGIVNSRVENDTWEYIPSQPLTGSPSTISIATGGIQTFTLNAGTRNAGRNYWIFGSVTGTSPGVALPSPAASVNMPLNPDFWTDITIGFANTSLLAKTRGWLDNLGKGLARFNVPKITNSSAIGVKFYHAYLIYAANDYYMASNPVELRLVK